MTAAYVEHRFGVREFADQIEAAREKYLEIRSAGLDRSLVFPNWDKPTAADRSLVYDKGALVLHELRNLLGEDKVLEGSQTLHPQALGAVGRNCRFPKSDGRRQWAETVCLLQAVGRSPLTTLGAHYTQAVNATSSALAVVFLRPG